MRIEIHVLQNFAPSNLNRDDLALDSAILAAGLFAWVKGDCPHSANINFGRAFGAGLSVEDKEQREKRFTHLLDTDINELSGVLRQAVSFIRGQSLDWESFILHLMHWDHPDRWVQKAWARGFWMSSPTDNLEEATTNTPN